MSIEVELNGKAGRVCKEALAGQTHCPLIVRTTSEDVLVGNVFGLLRHIRPHLWLNPLLNLALYGDANARVFRQVYFKKFQIRLWERQERFPPELLDFREGRSEPDIIVEWENPPTTIWIEAKYNAKLAEATSNSPHNNQVIRGIRTVLAATGNVAVPGRLFPTPKRRGVWLALLSHKDELLVERYRGVPQIVLGRTRQCPVRADLQGDVVGTVTWREVQTSVCAGRALMVRIEQMIADHLSEYLAAKSSSRR